MSQPANPAFKIATIGGRDVTYDKSANLLRWLSGLTIDADGSPRAYGPNNTGLDLTAYAGRPGKWWGIATDRKGNPYVQPNGMYVSTTAYQRPGFRASDPRRYVDSETVPFIVIPGVLIDKIRPVLLGSLATVRNTRNGRECTAVVADIGPNNHLGEGSMALATALGINPNPRTGGTNAPIIEVTVHPGQPATINGEIFPLQPKGVPVPQDLATLYTQLLHTAAA